MSTGLNGIDSGWISATGATVQVPGSITCRDCRGRRAMVAVMVEIAAMVITMATEGTMGMTRQTKESEVNSCCG